MGNSINVMGLEIDILSEETFQNDMNEYLSNDYLNIVHLISLDYMDAYEEDEQVREVLEEADLVLPGEKAILTSCHVDVLETGGMVVDYRTAWRLCGNGMMDGKSCYLVFRNKKEAKVVYRYLLTHCPRLEVVGLYTLDSGISGEYLVNDINTKVPDLILMSLESTQGEQWLHDNKAKINAKLCIVMSSVMNMIIRENIHIPKVLKSLHLGKIYTMLARLPYSNMWRKRIFRKKMDNYNNRKLMETADVREELPYEKDGEK